MQAQPHTRTRTINEILAQQHPALKRTLVAGGLSKGLRSADEAFVQSTINLQRAGPATFATSDRIEPYDGRTGPGRRGNRVKTLPAQRRVVQTVRKTEEAVLDAPRSNAGKVADVEVVYYRPEEAYVSSRLLQGKNCHPQTFRVRNGARFLYFEENGLRKTSCTKSRFGFLDIRRHVRLKVFPKGEMTVTEGL